MKKFAVLLSALLILIVCYAVFQYQTLHDGKLHVIICNVGQGDAALIHTPHNGYLVLDGGPDDSVLSCLGRHLPFWERTLSLVLLSHPHYDHFTGLTTVMKRYTTNSFGTEKLSNPAASFQEFLHVVKQKDVPTTYLFAGDTFALGEGMTLAILAPRKDVLAATSPTGNITDAKEFTNLIQMLSYGKISFLFTGDSQAAHLATAVQQFPSESILVLQVPHHGSRFGLNEKLLHTLHPSLAYISVGKNTYGHPAPSTIELLDQAHIPFFRTDRNGDIEFRTDGETVTYSTDH